MAEYYPLLERAVAGLTESTAETRRSIYERARAALIGQLRHMDPPVPEEDIARESAALDEAIARVEAGVAEAAAPRPAPAAAPIRVPPSAQPAPPRRVLPSSPPATRTIPRPISPATPAAPPPAAAPPAAAPATPPPSLPIGTAPPVVPPPSRERPVIGQRPAPSIDRPAMPVVAPSPRVPPRPIPLATPRGTRPIMALRPVSTAPVGVVKPEAGLPTAGRLATDVAAAAEAPGAVERDGPAFEPKLDAVEETGNDRDGSSAGLPGQTSSKLRDAPMRPPAPRPQEARRFGWPAVAAAVVALVLMIGIGVAAYHMRDKPEQVVASHAGTAVPDAAAPNKVSGRAGGAADDTADPATAPTSGVAVPVPVGQNADAPAPAPAPAPASSIAVAQRAALLVDAPDDPQRVKTYVGTVVWHLDSVSPGQGQPLATAIKADVDIPDAQLKVTMLMQKNPEPQLPASHTIEFHFLPQPGNSLGPVKQINVPEMRKDDDAATGDPLSGVPVAITDNYFLVGLSRGAAESQNMRLMTERNWVDMSILFTSGKLGKLTFEKGSAGQRSFEDALKAWK
ncbi:MAG: hypothetical protein ACRYGP_29605 [Janthinobacterium lividum]